MIAMSTSCNQLSIAYLYPYRFTFGGVIAERVNTAKTCRN